MPILSSLLLLGLVALATCESDVMALHSRTPNIIAQGAPSTKYFSCSLGAGTINQAAVSIVPPSTASHNMQAYLSTQPITQT